MKKSMIQHIKSLVLMAVLALPVGVMFSSCSSDNDPFFTANEDDYPIILNSDLETNTEWVNGEPPVLATITSKENFVYEAIVTPAHYTTVTWFIDGVQVAEGKTIDYGPLTLGEHVLKIVATTTKGKETSRTRKIAVKDPTAGNDIHDRLVKQGSVAQLHGDDIAKIVKVIIGTQTVDATYNESDKCIEYTVPDLPDGVYTLQLVDANGHAYDGGEIELNNNPQYPVDGEMTLWEGSHEIDWGTPWENAEVTAKLKEKAKVGTVLRLYVERTAGDYCKGCATVDWANISTGSREIVDGDGLRGDIDISNETEFIEFELTETSFELLNQGNLKIVGHGYNLLKVSINISAETALWEGSHEIDWGTPWENADVTAKLKEKAKVGSILRLYVERTAGDYCKGCATVDWANISTGSREIVDGDGLRGDIDINYDTEFIEFELTEKSFELLNQGNLKIVGHGYNLTKVTFE
jgi:hypothetical protein